MLSLSRTTGHAILALSCLEGLVRISLCEEDLARCQGISRAYLSKIIHKLAKKGFGKTKRVPREGCVPQKRHRLMRNMGNVEFIGLWIPHARFEVENVQSNFERPTQLETVSIRFKSKPQNGRNRM